MLRLKELPDGFQVLFAEAALIDSLKPAHRKTILDFILSNQTNHPEMVCCMAMFKVESAEAAKCSFFASYGLGPYSNLAAIKEIAAIDNEHRDELIQMLNKEL
jgi:hypothetical protein